MTKYVCFLTTLLQVRDDRLCQEQNQNKNFLCDDGADIRGLHVDGVYGQKGE